MLQESQRAMDIMRRRAVEQRRCSRVHMTLPASVMLLQYGAIEHTALIRDMNTLGVFFFSNLVPELGQRMKIQFAFPDGTKLMNIVCEGIVVRVEKGTDQAATGIALKFNGRDVELLGRVA